MRTPPLPPYTLRPNRFALPALAVRAARAPLGGAREATLACFMAAHLAGHRPAAALLPAPARREREAAVRAWFASLALPAALRAALRRFSDALARGSAADAAAALGGVQAAARRFLDPACQRELDDVARALAASD